MAAMMAAKKSMKFHRMYLLKGRFINSYILFTALRKVSCISTGRIAVFRSNCRSVEFRCGG